MYMYDTRWVTRHSSNNLVSVSFVHVVVNVQCTHWMLEIKYTTDRTGNCCCGGHLHIFLVNFISLSLLERESLYRNATDNAHTFFLYSFIVNKFQLSVQKNRKIYWKYLLDLTQDDCVHVDDQIKKFVYRNMKHTHTHCEVCSNSFCNSEVLLPFSIVLYRIL